jgi:NitT/TauT family transport system permease protein
MATNQRSPRLVPADARSRLRVLAAQLLVAFVVLAGWESLPKIGTLSDRFHLFNPFFVSSPSRIVQTLSDLVTGSNDSVLIWPYIWPTLSASLIGAGVGMGLGALFGLMLSNSAFLSTVLWPFVVGLNAVPRIALIPIIVLLNGPTFQASIVISILVVFFVAFFNAFEGGRSVAPQLMQNALLLGATKLQIMLHVRAPYVLAWTLAALPLGATFGIVTVVTGEIFTGQLGLGRLLFTASSTADASLTFAVVIVLSVLGVVVVSLAELVKARVLHWWTQE